MATAGSSSPAVCYLPTNEAYDRWSAVYDTDGNFLQKIDDAQMKGWLFPRLLDALRGPTAPAPEPADQNGRIVVDLGCGTGRNTALLLSPPAADLIGEMIALDASQGMLDVAQARLLSSSSSSAEGKRGEAAVAAARPRLHLIHHDLLSTPTPPGPARGTADAVISTLVLEHVPLRAFFAHAAAMLKPGGGGGVLLLTNMHADMGRLSQAGFVDAETGVKVRPTSYAHTVADVVAEAGRWGFRVMDDGWRGDGEEGEEERGVRGVKEVMVGEDMVEALGPRSRKWVGVTCWFGCLFKKDREGVE